MAPVTGVQLGRYFYGVQYMQAVFVILLLHNWAVSDAASLGNRCFNLGDYYLDSHDEAADCSRLCPEEMKPWEITNCKEHCPWTFKCFMEQKLTTPAPVIETPRPIPTNTTTQSSDVVPAPVISTAAKSFTLIVLTIVALVAVSICITCGVYAHFKHQSKQATFLDYLKNRVRCNRPQQDIAEQAGDQEPSENQGLTEIQDDPESAGTSEGTPSRDSGVYQPTDCDSNVSGPIHVVPTGSKVPMVHVYAGSERERDPLTGNTSGYASGSSTGSLSNTRETTL